MNIGVDVATSFSPNDLLLSSPLPPPVIPPHLSTVNSAPLNSRPCPGYPNPTPWSCTAGLASTPPARMQSGSSSSSF